MGNLNGAELRRIEKQYAEGIKAAAVVDIFQAKGHRFSEATLRKYVQIGLLPKSRRVGVRGRHRGSSGLYPVSIVRLVNDIKQALDAGATLDEVRLGVVGLAGEVSTLRRAAADVLKRFSEAIVQITDAQKRAELKRVLAREVRALQQRLKDLDKLAARMGRRTA